MLMAMHKVLLWAGLVGCSSVGPGGEPGVDGSAPRMKPIDWRTESTLFRASSIEIQAGGQVFTVAADDVHINPGMANPTDYTTLEATWLENNLEMRVNAYLHSDGVEWWCDELRHYDGAVQGEWITYQGDFFRSPVGMPFVGDVELGTLVLRDVFMTSFLGVPCDGSGHSVLAYRSVIELWASGGSFFRLPVYVRDATCANVALPAGATVEWSIDDPSIATVQASLDGGFTAAADFQAVAVGSTMATITLRDANSVQLAQQRVPVIVQQTWP